MKIHVVPLGIDNCYLLEGVKSVFIDGGAPGQSLAFVKRLAELRVDPTKIDVIILTHAHWDHIGSVHAVVEQTGAKLAVHARERAIVERGLKSMPPGVTLWRIMFCALLRATLPFIVIPPVRVDIEIGDDGFSLEPYGMHGQVIHQAIPLDQLALHSIRVRPSLAISP
jgi:hydroxyacylglutathione hydrolase